jgi:hypothetical protein
LVSGALSTSGELPESVLASLFGPIYVEAAGSK